MLKIKKTKPYQLSKQVHIIICTIALICGIVPSLALLSNYNVAIVSAARKTLSNITTMQEMTPEICANSALGQSNTLTDIRDNSTYTVARLSDGNCWMTQNLRLDISEAYSLSGDNTDIAEGTTWPETDVETPMETEDGTWTTDNSAVLFAKHPVKINGNSNGDGLYQDSYGYYYSWCAATAGTCKNSSGEVLENGNASGSICPKGWQLPTGGESGDFQVLYDKFPSANLATIDGAKGRWFGASNISSGGAFFPAAGYVSNNGLGGGGTDGDYWSSTSHSSSHAYLLSALSSIVYPATNGSKYGGGSVRCLAPASSTDFPDRFDEKDVEVIAVRVAPVISIDATSGMKEEVDPNKITTGTISATVSANTTYTVQLSANKTSLTNSALGVDTEITSSNSIPASTNVQAKTNAWGILNQDNSTYSAITTIPTNYYNTEEYNEAEQSTKHTFGIGVSISPTLPAGEYSTTVTITAVNN